MEASQDRLIGSSEGQVFKCGLCEEEGGFTRCGLLRHYVDVHSVSEGKGFGVVVVLGYKKRKHRATKKSAPDKSS